MPINHDQAMADAIDAIGRLTYRQLIVLQMQLGILIFDTAQKADQLRAEREAKTLDEQRTFDQS